MAAAMAVAGLEDLRGRLRPVDHRLVALHALGPAGGPESADPPPAGSGCCSADCRRPFPQSTSRPWRRSWTGRRRRSFGAWSRRPGRPRAALGLMQPKLPRVRPRQARPRRPTRRTGLPKPGCRRRMRHRPLPRRRERRRPCRMRRPSPLFRPGPARQRRPSPCRRRRGRCRRRRPRRAAARRRPGLSRCQGRRCRGPAWRARPARPTALARRSAGRRRRSA